MLAGLVVAAAAGASVPRPEWRPRDFGAVADGASLDTAAIQAAIAAAHAAGGGRVVLDPGVYLSGTIRLLSNVELHLAAGATLRGSPRIADYRRGNWPALILARGQQRVAITGAGVIDGQGAAVARDTERIYETGDFLQFFPGLREGDPVYAGSATVGERWFYPHALHRVGELGRRVAPRSRADLSTWRVDEMVRPQLLEFWQCRDVTVSGVTLRDAANWVQTYRDCDGVVVRGVTVRSTTYWNNDGLDVVNSRRVLIEDCDIDAADDGICLKSEWTEDGGECTDITVRRCRIRTSASAFKIGTGSHIAFRRIVVEDLEVYDTYRSAIALETVDGAVLEDVRISRVRARNTGNALFMRIGQRHTKQPGVLRNVVVDGLEVEIPAGKPDAGYPHEGPPLKVPANVMPASIVGLPDRPVEDVVLRNVTLRYAGGGSVERAEVRWTDLAVVPENRAGYPEFSMFGELPSWGFFMRHARGLKIEQLRLELGGDDYRPALVVDNVEGLVWAGADVVAPRANPPGLIRAGGTMSGGETIRWPDDWRDTLREVSVPMRPTPATP